MSFGSDDQDIALPRTRPFPNRVSLEYSEKKVSPFHFFFACGKVLAGHLRDLGGW